MIRPVVVLRLPGAGMIESGPKSEIAWLAYRELRIDASFYKRLILEIASADSAQRFVIISGGLGTHLYTNLAKDLGLSVAEFSACARRQIATLQSVICAFATANGVDVNERQIPIDEIASEALICQKKLLFVEPSAAHPTTDDLAADVARLTSASQLILFKTRAPRYTIGFEQDTLVTRWSIDDLKRRAARHEGRGVGSYIITSTAIEIIREATYRVSIRSPSAPVLLGDHEDFCFSTVVER